MFVIGIVNGQVPFAAYRVAMYVSRLLVKKLFIINALGEKAGETNIAIAQNHC